MEEKLYQLRQLLRRLGKIVISYSGGVDSSFLLKIAKEELDNNVTAVIVRSVTMFSEELNFAEKFAAETGVNSIVKDIDLLSDSDIKNNKKYRCYNCKYQIFKIARETADSLAVEYVLDGTNYDDLKEFRPGRKAAKEYNIKSPLMELKFSKSEIRYIMKKMGMSIWDKESNTCLLTRFPENYEVSLQELRTIERLENFIRSLYKFKRLRLRVLEKKIKIEVDEADKNVFYNRKISSIIFKEIEKAGYTAKMSV